MLLKADIFSDLLETWLARVFRSALFEPDIEFLPPCSLGKTLNIRIIKIMTNSMIVLAQYVFVWLWQVSWDSFDAVWGVFVFIGVVGSSSSSSIQIRERKIRIWILLIFRILNDNGGLFIFAVVLQQSFEAFLQFEYSSLEFKSEKNTFLSDFFQNLLRCWVFNLDFY